LQQKKFRYYFQMPENKTSKKAGEVVELKAKSVVAIEPDNATAPAQSDDWITARIAQAVKEVAVADAVVLKIKKQLNGTMCERALRPAELNTLANTLLEATDNPTTGEAIK
jgi:hypothetical protein